MHTKRMDGLIAVDVMCMVTRRDIFNTRSIISFLEISSAILSDAICSPKGN